MTASAPTPAAPADDHEECWCCGALRPRNCVVRLDNHPEVVLCTDCARFVHLQARELDDRSRTGFAVRVRDVARRARRDVIERGWHRGRVIGGPLRWLGRHLP